MTSTKKKVLSLFLVFLLGLMCFGMVGCSEGPNPLSLKDNPELKIAVGGSKAEMLKDVTLVYTDPYLKDGDDSETIVGYEAMCEKGVSIMGFDASQEAKDSGRELFISIAYNGYTFSYPYIII